ncbi:biotin--[acetyl-CoA-carboxylase] ligase [Candidatus Kryptobacter tengchongensis]|nr:biotin--[acetyl-CoA-carboxylase] ligase [Candidatus Kryptobacter tengchongensis]
MGWCICDANQVKFTPPMEFNEKSISTNLNTKIFGKRIFFFKSIKSTMDYAKKIAERDEPEGTVIIADYQSHGRGRFGRIWKSEPGKNILMSIILRPTIPLEKFSILPFLFSVSVAEAIEKNTNLKITTKWPNDLLINNRKFCGILMEASITADKGDFVILGIGINVNQSEFPKEIQDYATSLYLSTGKVYDRAELTKDILRQIEVDYEKLNKDRDFKSVIERWKKRCTMLGQKITVIQSGKTITGKAIDIDETGFLLLEDETSKIIKLSSGDVTVVK